MVRQYSQARDRRKKRIRAKISGTAKRPRAVVFRSQKYIYVQLIDDEKRQTILGMSDRRLREIRNKIERAKTFGKLLAEHAKTKKIDTIVFDRGGYAYHGRIQAVAEGLREGGLSF